VSHRVMTQLTITVTKTVTVERQACEVFDIEDLWEHSISELLDGEHWEETDEMEERITDIEVETD